MNIATFFKVQCGLFVAAVGGEKMNGCITNTLMQQSHAPVRFSVTIGKANFTHDLIVARKTLAVSALSEEATVDLVRHFGFVSGREKDKFADFAQYSLDQNGNPCLNGNQIAASYSLRVYDTVDIDTHTMFLCTVDDAVDLGGAPITYWGYRESLKK